MRKFIHPFCLFLGYSPKPPWRQQLTLDQTWMRQGLVAVPWVRFGGGSDDLPQKKGAQEDFKSLPVFISNQ